MKGMRTRRRWWFASLALALLAACVGVWKWSERPPYKFLEGASLIFTEVGDPLRHSNDCHSYFASSRPVDQLMDEIIALPFSNKARNSSLWGYAHGVEFQFYDVNAWNEWPEGILPRAPSGTTAVIEVVRPPTKLDKVRGWLAGFRWKGARGKMEHQVQESLSKRARAGL